jgi:hypothetical protein
MQRQKEIIPRTESARIINSCGCCCPLKVPNANAKTTGNGYQYGEKDAKDDTLDGFADSVVLL